jgi:hypothetical protein
MCVSHTQLLRSISPAFTTTTTTATTTTNISSSRVGGTVTPEMNLW